MSKIEIIYLKHKKNEQVFFGNSQNNNNGYIIEDLNSSVKIYSKPEIKKEETIKKTDTKQIKNIEKRNYKRFLTIFTIICLLTSSIGLIAFDAGYLPVRAFLPEREPVGAVGSIEIDNFIRKYGEITEISVIENLKYKIYISEASPDNIIENYKYQLKNEGYELRHQGITTKRGIEFQYFGFVKGITSIGLIITDDIDQVISQKTTILYTTGSIFNYQKILSALETNN